MLATMTSSSTATSERDTSCSTTSTILLTNVGRSANLASVTASQHAYIVTPRFGASNARASGSGKAGPRR